MSLWLSIALQAAEAAPVAKPFDLAGTTKPIGLNALPKCDDTLSADEIVVCGRRRDQYRLPLREEPAPDADAARGAEASGLSAITPSGRCGIFAGERRCSKREAAAYGYGNGRDPITLLTRLAKKALDPDGE
ncbi:hypothetical protein J2X47_002040 [Sphingomonas sp. BE270]|jgi:hypothetical protein|uniref:hypothetical protein n=1 Tax=unclassified Sphingomonas TaxID=196159 RepID=UPI000F8794EA|nr:MULTISPECIES: hypothetical protein [unclassified Sphingomonas]MDR6850132.1 hypothetical protein [Sphingomonas sp. BE137]MDR7257860.1 hypothetical protein [Sphingomonas sp. BE270]RUN77786.1 hypothetical protein EJC47_05225 [Sphingomonas sp. TF3]